MTLLDDRPVTGLTTPYRSDASFDWPTGLSATSPKPKAASPKSRAIKLAITGPAGPAALPPHIRDMEEKINRLLALPVGWNHRGAKPVTMAAVESTIQVLLALLTPTSLPVQLFPLPDGGIQAEWHASGNSIEIEIDGNGDPFVSAENSDEEVIVEADLDATSLKGPMKETRRFLARMSRSVGVHYA
ncbi:hypothetical protein [Streptomyces scabiei]|uniref:hypothetical protein n=1 Tax=Streptomyces scabiei TaxID=1930 RepID=UPI0029AD4EC1|nr:hypothetical protein [Streptomyces scabiei]MDX3114601.1 hypothetical protein [Streptomyces scabiei]